MMVYLVNPKESAFKSLQVTELGKVTGYNINMQRWTAFLYSSDEHMETKIKHPCYNCLKKKYLGINLTKHCSEPDVENYKI